MPATCQMKKNESLLLPASISIVSLLLKIFFLIKYFFTAFYRGLFCFKCGLLFGGDWGEPGLDPLEFHLNRYAACPYPHLKLAEVARWRRANPEREHLRNDYIRSITFDSYILIF